MPLICRDRKRNQVISGSRSFPPYNSAATRDSNIMVPFFSVLSSGRTTAKSAPMRRSESQSGLCSGRPLDRPTPAATSTASQVCRTHRKPEARRQRPAQYKSVCRSTRPPLMRAPRLPAAARPGAQKESPGRTPLRARSATAIPQPSPLPRLWYALRVHWPCSADCR